MTDELNDTIKRLRAHLKDAEDEAQESLIKVADMRTQPAVIRKGEMNSYGAGYDRGYANALREVLVELTGEE